MARILASLVSGLLFGGGLTVSQMINPAKILNFLDIFGAWDPSLAFVLGGAAGVTLLAFPVVLRRPAPVLAPRFYLPSKTDIDARLLGGAVLFGVGWGLIGLCPGPALAALSVEFRSVALFVMAMIVGAALVRLVPDPNAAAEGGIKAQQTRHDLA